MPAAVPVIAGAVISGFAAGATAVAIGAFSWAAFGASLILGGLSYALTPKPKIPGAQNAGGSIVAIRQSDLTRQHVYGHTRITRGYAHMQSTGLNGTLHMILMLCEGPLRNIGEIWVNDYVIPEDAIDANGNVTSGRYAGFMTIRKHLGTETQGADHRAVANMPVWTESHRMSGIAYLYITMKKNQDVFPTGVPNITAIVEGKPLYDPRKEADSWTTNIALQTRDFLTNDRYGFGAQYDDIDDLNVAVQANICDEIVATNAEQTSVTNVNSSNNLISLDGDILNLQYGDRVKYSSTGNAPSGISKDNYYYVIPYQIKGTPRIGLATTFENAMNKQYVVLGSGATGTAYITKDGEPRYHGGGAFDTETNLSQTLNDLCASMAGRATNIGGFWTILCGAWRTPELTFTIGDVRGDGMAFKNGLSMADSFNVVKGLYTSSVNYYQTTDYPSARYQTFIDQDNGIESVLDKNLPFTNRAHTAQRIAKIELFRARQDIVVNADFSTKAMKVQPGDNIFLDNERLGWLQKPFEITQFSFNMIENSIVCSMTLRETAREIFDWSAGEAIDLDPQPNTNLPNPFDVMAITGMSYSSRNIGTENGDTVFTLTLNWEEHPDSFVQQFGQIEVQYKKSSEQEWRPSFKVSGLLTTTDVLNSSVNIGYDLRIRAINYLGARSSWTTLYGAVVGSSGGVTETNDWRFVYENVSHNLDWGYVYDTPTIEEDWGYVV